MQVVIRACLILAMLKSKSRKKWHIPLCVCVYACIQFQGSLSKLFPCKHGGKLRVLKQHRLKAQDVLVHTFLQPEMLHLEKG